MQNIKTHLWWYWIIIRQEEISTNIVTFCVYFKGKNCDDNGHLYKHVQKANILYLINAWSKKKNKTHLQQQPDTGVLLWSLRRASTWCIWRHLCQFWKEKVSGPYVLSLNKLIFYIMIHLFMTYLCSYMCMEPHFVSIFRRKSKSGRQKQLIPKVRCQNWCSVEFIC